MCERGLLLYCQNCDRRKFPVTSYFIPREHIVLWPVTRSICIEQTPLGDSNKDFFSTMMRAFDQLFKLYTSVSFSEFNFNFNEC